MLPTCKIHTKQQFKAGICQARLQCGAKCGAKFRWEPYGFSLCSTHAKIANLMPCYLLKIPTELRCRIYSFLLPDQTIPARFTQSSILRSDSKPCYPQILRVNHQIYEEAAIILYAQNTFEIEVSGGVSIYMCNSYFGVQSFPTPNRGRPLQVSDNAVFHGNGAQGNYALQDYQMQLMLLEQQNKKRLLMARQEQDTINHVSAPPSTPSGAPSPRSRLDEVAFLSSDPNSHSHTSTWHPGRLSHANIDMIRSFRVNILFPCLPQPPPNVQQQMYIQQQQMLQQQAAHQQRQAQMAAQQIAQQQQAQMRAQMAAQQQGFIQQQQQTILGNMHPQMTAQMGFPPTPPPPPPPPPNPISHVLVPSISPPNPASNSPPPPQVRLLPSAMNHGPHAQPVGIRPPQQGPPGPLIHQMIGHTPTITLPPPPNGRLPQRATWAKVVLEKAQYETCDTLNQVVERLQLLPLPILRLNVSIHIDQYEKQEPALATAQLFLNTFRGLRNVVRPDVDRTIWADQFWHHKEIFYNLQDISMYPTTSSDFVNLWKVEVSQEGPAPDLSPVVFAYWVLHHICFDLQAHHEAASVLVSSADIHTLLLKAKMAREAEDMAALRTVGQKIQTIWKSYISKQRTFENIVSRKVAFVDGLLGSDDVDFPPFASSSSMQSYEGKGKSRAAEVGDLNRIIVS